MLLNDIVIHQIKGEWKITSLWVTAYRISAKGETVSQGFWELKNTDLYLSQHLLRYYWLVGCTNCGYTLIQTKHWTFKNQCRMQTVAFLNAAWFLFFLTAKALTEHQHMANAQVWGVSQVCAAQYCSAVRNKEQSCLCSIACLKPNCISRRAPEELTRSCVTMCQETSEAS